MIKIVQGNILLAEVEAIVNTVNTVGVMGKGIALAFKKSFPLNYNLYKGACAKNEIHVGSMFVTRTNQFMPKYIINFPTKEHRKSHSEINFIIEGMVDLVSCIKGMNIKSVAIPPLGCGNGGLEWELVKDVILK